MNLILILLLNLSPVNSSFTYKSWEHAWLDLSTGVQKMSQNIGDQYCENEFDEFRDLNLGGYSVDGLWFWNQDVWHVWYHQDNHQCVLNFGKKLDES